MQASTINIFDMIANILLRCWVFSFVLLALWLGAALLMGDFIEKLHGPMFGITSHELDIIFYCGLGILKLFVLVFFFIPWLSIRLVLQKETGVVSHESVKR